MAIPRSKLIDPEQPGCYHLFSRCVRRAWLCGADPLTGRSFEHRRQWLEDRLLFLCQKFAVDLHGYAIMSNHYHLVVRLDPKAPLTWDDRLVAERWLDLYPPAAGLQYNARREARVAAICANPATLATYRQRLGSLSWMMRLLNESIARRANREDECTGRFWEGRFESQALLDDEAWLSATAYVDLNPVRAGMCADPLDGAHTSIGQRLRQVAHNGDQTRQLPPVVSGLATPAVMGLGLADYCELLRWTAATGCRRPSESSLARIGVNAEQTWMTRLARHGHHDWRAVGAPQAMHLYAQRIGQRWIRGIEAARRMIR